MKMNNNTTLDKSKGCLIGLACGDYLGMPYEFAMPGKVKKHFSINKLKPITIQFIDKQVTGFYTDDTSMAICLAESLLEKGFDQKDQYQKYKKWFYEGYSTPFGDKSYGVGQHTLRVFIEQTEDNIPTTITHNHKAGGNGALMRCAPIGIRYNKDINQLVQNSIKSALVTHNNHISAWSCVILNLCISYALQEIDKTDYCNLILDSKLDIPQDIKELLQTDFNKLDQNLLHTTGYSLYTLAIALHSFFTTDTLEDCITQAIALGGDTDTQGAVVGALAGAYYGYTNIPDDWVNSLINNKYIEELAVRLHETTL